MEASNCQSPRPPRARAASTYTRQSPGWAWSTALTPKRSPKFRKPRNSNLTAGFRLQLVKAIQKERSTGARVNRRNPATLGRRKARTIQPGNLFLRTGPQKNGASTDQPSPKVVKG